MMILARMLATVVRDGLTAFHNTHDPVARMKQNCNDDASFYLLLSEM